MSLTSGLTEFWKLNEASGTRFGALTAYDLLDSGATGAYRTEEGVVCATFDGITALSVASAAPLQIDVAQGLTLSCWLKLNERTADQYRICGKGAGLDGNEYGIDYLDFGSGVGRMYVFRVGNLTDYSTSSLTAAFADTNAKIQRSLGQWFHLCGTYTGGAHPATNMYMNGEKIGSFGNINPALITATTAQFAVGAGVDAAGLAERLAIGNICNVGLWARRCLNDGEIGDLYNTGVTRTYPFTGA